MTPCFIRGRLSVSQKPKEEVFNQVIDAKKNIISHLKNVHVHLKQDADIINSDRTISKVIFHFEVIQFSSNAYTHM